MTLRGKALPFGLAAALAAAAVLATEARSANAANPGFEKMKSLVGEWEGTMSEGGRKMPVSVSYRLVSNGTALQETLQTEGETDMVTMYVPDGDRLAMTHYCAEGNQPRMRAAVPKGDVARLEFRFVDGTNLPAGPDASYMSGLVVTFKDGDHFAQAWTHRMMGKDSTGLFEYSRKK